MQRIVLDARTPKLVGEISEQCRLSNTPLTVVTTESCSLDFKMIGQLWDRHRGALSNSVALEKWVVPGDSASTAELFSRIVHPGDVAITEACSVAQASISAGAVVLSPAGRRFTENTASFGAGSKDGSDSPIVVTGWEPDPTCNELTRESAIRLLERIAVHIPSFVKENSAPKIDGLRLIIDADKMRLEPALAVARSWGIPVKCVWGGIERLQNGLLLSDALEEQAASGYWVELVNAGAGGEESDAVISRLARGGDLVFTNDNHLTLRCIDKGASVIDRRGICVDSSVISRPLQGLTALRELKMQGSKRKKRRPIHPAIDFMMMDSAEKQLQRLASDRQAIADPA